MGCHLQRRWCHHPTGHGVMAGGASCSPGISAFPQTPGSTQQVPSLGPWHHTVACCPCPRLVGSTWCLACVVPITHSGHLNVCGAFLYFCLRSLSPIPASLSPALNLFSLFSLLCQCFQISLVLCLPTSESLSSQLHVSCPSVFLASYLSISASPGLLCGGTSLSPPPAVRPWGAGDSGSVISEDSAEAPSMTTWGSHYDKLGLSSFLSPLVHHLGAAISYSNRWG